MEVIIDLDSIYASQSGNILGNIHLQTDKTAYPQYAWSDFIVVLLDWWADAATILHYSDSKSPVELLFMDGPYSMRLRRIDGKTGQAQFTGEDEQEVDLHMFMQSLKKAIKQVINKCQRAGWHHAAAALEYRLKSLNNLTSQ